MTKVRHDRAWVSERPKIRPKPNWTPEEDEKLLELKPKLLHGKWEKLSIELGHTPYDCVERWTELTQMDDTTIMKETLRVKDEELQNLARELRARDSTIMDDQRRVAFAEKEQLKQSFEKQLESTATKLRECEEKAVELSKEKDQLVKQRDSAIQEAYLWRTELGKARDRVVILEAVVVRAEEKARNAEIDAETKIKEAAQRELATFREKEDLKIYVDALQAKLQSQQQMETKEVCEKTESPSDMSDTRSLTKHVDSSDENVDKPCLSVSKSVPITEDGDLRISEGSQGIVHRTDDNQWNDIQATESTISDVREVATDDRPA